MRIFSFCIAVGGLQVAAPVSRRFKGHHLRQPRLITNPARAGPRKGQRRARALRPVADAQVWKFGTSAAIARVRRGASEERGLAHARSRRSAERAMRLRCSAIATVAVLARKMQACHEPGRPTIGVMMPNANGAGTDLVRCRPAGRLPACCELHLRASTMLIRRM